MQYETLNLAFAGQIATVTLNRPDVRNAFNETMIAEVTSAFAALNARDDVRAVVLAANGKAFCAGADLNWMKKMAAYSDAENRADAMLLANMLASIYRCNKPVIARVNGDAYAGGMGLISACDIVVAVESARITYTTAEQFDCATAHRLGLVSEVVGMEQLDTTVQQIAQTLCANGPQAVRACKQLVQDIAGHELNEAMIEDTAARIARTRAGAEGREGVASFLEKRTPSWRS
jgi:methylglutaconyl-CoA hydratase